MKKITSLLMLFLMCLGSSVWAQLPKVSTETETYLYYVLNAANDYFVINPAQNTQVLRSSNTNTNERTIFKLKADGNNYKLYATNVGNGDQVVGCEDKNNGADKVKLLDQEKNSSFSLSIKTNGSNTGIAICSAGSSHSWNMYGGQGANIGLFDDTDPNGLWLFIPANEEAFTASKEDVNTNITFAETNARAEIGNVNKESNSYKESHDILKEDVNLTYSDMNARKIIRDAFVNIDKMLESLYLPNGYYIMKNVDTSRKEYLYSDILRADNSKHQTLQSEKPESVTNRYLWKVTNEGTTVRIVNGQGSLLRADNAGPFETLHFGKFLTGKAGIFFKEALNCSNGSQHLNNTHCLTTWKSGGSKVNDNRWIFEPSTNSASIYEVKIEGVNNDLADVCYLQRDQEVALNGGFVISEQVPTEQDCQLISKEGRYVKTSFKVEGKVITVTVAKNFPGLITKLIDETRGMLNKCKGKVGYPVDSKVLALEEALKTYEGKTTETDYNALLAKVNDFKSSVDVNMPEAGKAYVFTNVHPSQGKHYINYSDSTNGLTYVARGEGDANSLPMSAKFICQKVGDKYIFVNNAGKYLVFKGNGNKIGENTNKGYVDSYNGTYCSMTFKKMALNGNNTGAASSLVDLFGYVAFGGQRKDKANQSSYFMYSRNGENHFNQDSNWTFRYSNDYSTAFLMEEVSYPNNPTLTTIEGEMVKIQGATSIATFSAPFATVIPSDVSAYYITSVNANNAALAKVEGTVLPKNTGVILAGTTAGNVTMVPATEAGTTLTSTNLLMNTAGAAKENVAANSIFILAKGKNGIGFYYGQAGNLAMNKAYVEKSSVVAAGVNALKLVYGGETTGVEGVEVEENVNAPIFDLSGRRVMNTIKGGIYIQNGKKFIVK